MRLRDRAVLTAVLLFSVGICNGTVPETVSECCCGVEANSGQMLFLPNILVHNTRSEDNEGWRIEGSRQTIVSEPISTRHGFSVNHYILKSQPSPLVGVEIVDSRLQKGRSVSLRRNASVVHFIRLIPKSANGIGYSSIDTRSATGETLSRVVYAVSSNQHIAHLRGRALVVGVSDYELQEGERSNCDRKDQLNVSVGPRSSQLAKIAEESLLFLAVYGCVGCAILVCLLVLACASQGRDFLWLIVPIICVGCAVLLIHWGITLGLYS
jgi:hypothetical protein